MLFFHILAILLIAPSAYEAHDCRMTAPGRQLLNRGASILSALVFVALLAGVATTVQYFSPYANVESQTAEAAAPAAAAPKTESTPIPECDDVRKKPVVLTEKAEKAEKESCVCLDSKARAYKKDRYRVEAQLQKNGNPAAKTTAIISEDTTSSKDWKCVIEECAPESKGTKCRPFEANQY